MLKKSHRSDSISQHFFSRDDILLALIFGTDALLDLKVRRLKYEQALEFVRGYLLR